MKLACSEEEEEEESARCQGTNDDRVEKSSIAVRPMCENGCLSVLDDELNSVRLISRTSGDTMVVVVVFFFFFLSRSLSVRSFVVQPKVYRQYASRTMQLG
jgi:hypothetical protein